MDEFVYYGELFNIYKSLLNESNCKYYSLYYEENLSLQEIADLENVSKSYVGNIIKKTTERLKEYESILKLYERRVKLESILVIDDVLKIKNVIKEVLN